MELADWYDPDQTYECAFCGQTIEHTGYDPCEVSVESRRDDPADPGRWWFWAHAACVRDALSDDLRAEVGYLYEQGHAEPDERSRG